MPTEMPPEVGTWYRRADRPQPFQVVAVDKDDATVDIEYFDGTVDEWPLSHWYALAIEESGEPADASGAYDDLDDDGREQERDRVDPDLRAQIHVGE